jgi:hypothetical protein
MKSIKTTPNDRILTFKRPASISQPDAVSDALSEECNHIALILSQAFRVHSTIYILYWSAGVELSTVPVQWSAAAYADILTPMVSGQNEEQEQQYTRQFPPSNQPPFPWTNDPAIVVDRDGVILLWYLPRVLSAARLVSQREFCAPL